MNERIPSALDRAPRNRSNPRRGQIVIEFTVFPVDRHGRTWGEGK